MKSIGHIAGLPAAWLLIVTCLCTVCFRSTEAASHHCADPMTCRVALQAHPGPNVGSMLMASASVADVNGCCLRLADRLFEAEAWDVAITEYKRDVFFGAPGSDRDHAAGRIGLAYEYLEQYEAAERAFRRAAQLASTDSTREARRFDAARIAIRRGETGRAELELARLKLFATQSTSRHRAALQLVRIELRGHRWDEMQASLDSIPGFFTTADGSRLGALLSAARTERQRSPAGARRLSTWLPGSGQIYSGAVLQGLHSLALNGVLVWQLADAVRHLSVGNAVIASSFLHRYYRGGQYNAARLAEERNARRLGPLLEEMEELLNGMDRE